MQWSILGRSRPQHTFPGKALMFPLLTPLYSQIKKGATSTVGTQASTAILGQVHRFHRVFQLTKNQGSWHTTHNLYPAPVTLDKQSPKQVHTLVHQIQKRKPGKPLSPIYSHYYVILDYVGNKISSAKSVSPPRCCPLPVEASLRLSLSFATPFSRSGSATFLPAIKKSAA